MEDVKMIQITEKEGYSISHNTIAYGLELYWINQLKKNNLVSEEEYMLIKADIHKKYKKVGE